MSIDPTHNYFNIIEKDRLPWKEQKKPLENEQFWGEDGFSFDDLIDIVNPLHHIPVVSEIYSSATGDEKSTGSDLAGGAIFGGILGFAFSFIDSIIKEGTGKTMGEHMIALFDNEVVDNTSNTEASANSAVQTNRLATNQTKVDFAPPKQIQKLHADVATQTYNKIQKMGKADLPFVQNDPDKESKYSYFA